MKACAYFLPLLKTLLKTANFAEALIVLAKSAKMLIDTLCKPDLSFTFHPFCVKMRDISILLIHPKHAHILSPLPMQVSVCVCVCVAPPFNVLVL